MSLGFGFSKDLHHSQYALSDSACGLRCELLPQCHACLTALMFPTMRFRDSNPLRLKSLSSINCLGHVPSQNNRKVTNTHLKSLPQLVCLLNFLFFIVASSPLVSALLVCFLSTLPPLKSSPNSELISCVSSHYTPISTSTASIQVLPAIVLYATCSNSQVFLLPSTPLESQDFHSAARVILRNINLT